MKIEGITPSGFTAFRPNARAIADVYLQTFHPGARRTGDQMKIDDGAVPGCSLRQEFQTASGEMHAIYLGEAVGGGWQVKAKAKLVLDTQPHAAAGVTT